MGDHPGYEEANHSIEINVPGSLFGSFASWLYSSHAENASYKNKTLLHRHFDPPSCCIDLNVYYGGREIC
jgi:hypothetical protein